MQTQSLELSLKAKDSRQPPDMSTANKIFCDWHLLFMCVIHVTPNNQYWDETYWNKKEFILLAWLVVEITSEYPGLLKSILFLEGDSNGPHFF